MLSIRLTGSAAPHNNWSPTVNTDSKFSPTFSFLTLPTAIESLPETAAGLKFFIVFSLLLGTKCTQGFAEAINS